VLTFELACNSPANEQPPLLPGPISSFWVGPIQRRFIPILEQEIWPPKFFNFFQPLASHPQTVKENQISLVIHPNLDNNQNTTSKGPPNTKGRSDVNPFGG